MAKTKHPGGHKRPSITAKDIERAFPGWTAHSNKTNRWFTDAAGNRISRKKALDAYVELHKAEFGTDRYRKLYPEQKLTYLTTWLIDPVGDVDFEPVISDQLDLLKDLTIAEIREHIEGLRVRASDPLTYLGAQDERAKKRWPAAKVAVAEKRGAKIPDDVIVAREVVGSQHYYFVGSNRVTMATKGFWVTTYIMKTLLGAGEYIRYLYDAVALAKGGGVIKWLGGELEGIEGGEDEL